MRQALAEDDDDETTTTTTKQRTHVVEQITQMAREAATTTPPKKSTDLRLLGNQLGWTVQEYANYAALFIGKTTGFDNDDRDRWEAHLHELLEQKRQAEATASPVRPRKIVREPTVVKTTIVEDAPDFSPPEDETLTSEAEPAPFDLARRDAPV